MGCALSSMKVFLRQGFMKIVIKRHINYFCNKQHNNLKILRGVTIFAFLYLILWPWSDVLQILIWFKNILQWKWCFLNKLLFIVIVIYNLSNLFTDYHLYTIHLSLGNHFLISKSKAKFMGKTSIYMEK